ncbi:Trans-enoyl reductase fsa3 [Colletotrichum orbiculare MAFF 240422]|uniref:Trans-enoyl reductase fsa3 n=1 Tax=Colletotrichum orbiculare (strain 104-T / ATCC 96160 / CBS 514.97 / LARS 414 / MAFF 240422) TaxID=1213857 RepID=A0A484FH54_COLOR|nr:Trans-enoyl reductase fsa3 [Colletotrichum orbiculare MAFF 240422]
MAPEHCQALVTESPADSPSKDGRPILAKPSITTPQPAANQFLVKVSHVAQNPTDVQSLDSNAFGEALSLGDIVAGLIWGGEIKGVGGYSNVSSEEAATLPLASMTAWLALFSKDCLAIPRDSKSKTSLLVWGGSSSVGLYAIQIAALHGFRIVTTCSPRHFELVKSLGAAHAFDYRDKDVVDSIRKAAPDLKYVFDTIGNKTSSGTASQAIDDRGGALCTVRPGKANTEDVAERTKVTDVLVWTAFLKDHRYGDFHWPPHEDDHRLGEEFFANLPRWVEEGKIKPNKPTVIPGGLDGVIRGFQEYRNGNISATKLVYKL